MTSPLWRYRVTWRHRDHTQSIDRGQFPVGCSLKTSRYLASFPNISEIRNLSRFRAALKRTNSSKSLTYTVSIRMVVSIPLGPFCLCHCLDCLCACVFMLFFSCHCSTNNNNYYYCNRPKCNHEIAGNVAYRVSHWDRHIVLLLIKAQIPLCRLPRNGEVSRKSAWWYLC